MKFTETPLAGAYLIDIEPFEDERGLFARAFCRNEFERRGLRTEIVQANLSQNHRRGTLRGLHYQAAPHAEVKMVRCIRGAIYDVVVDVRPDSPTYRQWYGVELSAENRRLFYVPEGFAHGYQSLTDDSEVLYLVTAFYAPGHERAIRWDDPAIGIEWPVAEPILSAKDAAHPDLTP